MDNRKNTNLLVATAGLVGIIFAVFLIYWPSLSGPFIFDDEINLKPLASYAHLDELQRILIYITSGGTSLIERPLSLLSFYINDNTWPSSPESFRFTNIAIHALNAILVWWLSFRLIVLTNPDTSARKTITLASIIAIAWALHPIHVNAVAYIVQRMTLLSGTFVLSGLITYTYGRELIAKEKISKGLIYISSSILVFMPLAFLSKQTGILLPLFIAVIEFTLLNKLRQREIINKWSIFFIITPILMVITGFIIKADEKIFSWYDALTYTPAERLMTESRILFDYLGNILLPQAQTSSLFHDDYVISQSLTSPITTLPTILVIILGIFIVVLKRRQWPLLTFAISWFLAGHVLESTIIGLELYYEHRNYIPSFGILFALIIVGNRLLHTKTFLAPMLAACFVLLLSFVTHMNTSIWKNETKLISNWHAENPKSLRSAIMMTGVFYNTGNYTKARELLVQIINTWPKYPSPPLLLLLLDLSYDKIETSSVERALAQIPVDFPHNNVIADIVAKLYKPIAEGKNTPLTYQDIERIIHHLLLNPNTRRENASKKWKTITYNLYYHLAIIASKQRNLEKAMLYSNKANSIVQKPDIMILQVTWLMSAGLNEEALIVARKGLELSQKSTLTQYLNPNYDNLSILANNLEKITAKNGR